MRRTHIIEDAQVAPASSKQSVGAIPQLWCVLRRSGEGKSGERSCSFRLVCGLSRKVVSRKNENELEFQTASPLQIAPVAPKVFIL